MKPWMKTTGVGWVMGRARQEGRQLEFGEQFVEFEHVGTVVVEQLAHEFVERHAAQAVAQPAACELRGIERGGCTRRGPCGMP